MYDANIQETADHLNTALGIEGFRRISVNARLDLLGYGEPS
jgi:hypothetical protein